MNMTNTTTRLVAGVIFTALSASFSALAGAADSTQVTVKYTDLDVSSAPGATVLYKRIQMAAGKVCERLDHGDLSSKMNAKACSAKLIENAVGTVDRPALSAIYQSKDTRSPLVVAAR